MQIISPFVGGRHFLSQESVNLWFDWWVTHVIDPDEGVGVGEGKSGIELGPTFRRACPLLLSLSISKTISKFDTCTIRLGSTKPPHREVCNTRFKNISLFTTITCAHACEVHTDFWYEMLKQRDHVAGLIECVTTESKWILQKKRIEGGGRGGTSA